MSRQIGFRPCGMTELVNAGSRVTGLVRDQTLEKLNHPVLQQWFVEGQWQRPQFDSDDCVAQQLKGWCNQQQPDCVVAAGGDGTLNLLGQVAVGDPTATVLIPAGTANDFASGLPDSTVDQLVWSDVDVVSVQSPDHRSETSFVNMLALGCGARHSSDIGSDIKSTWGSMAYLIQAWQTLGDLRGFGLQLSCDQEDHHFDEVIQVFIANGRTCGGGYCVVDSAAYDDGLMDVVVIQQGTGLQIASFIQAYMVGAHLEHELCRHIRCSELDLQMSTSDAMTLDGEPSQLQQARIEVLKHRLPLAKLDPNSIPLAGAFDSRSLGT